MEGMRAASFGIEALSVVICIILLIQLCVVKRKHNIDRWLKAALACNIGMLLGDMTDWGLSGTGIPGSATILLVGMTLFFVCSGLVMMCFFAYAYTYINRKSPQGKFIFRFVVVLSLFEVVLALTTPFTGATFHITPEGVYVRGPLFYLTQVPSALAYLAVLCMYIRAWKALSHKERIYFSLYLVVPVVAEVVQVTTYDIALLPVSLMLTFLLVYTFISSELDKEVLESNRQIEEERIMRMRAMQDSQVELTKEITTALGNAVEAKDHYTNGHIQRVAWYTKELAGRLGLDAEAQNKAYYAGLLHDVGKIKVSDTIINKPGKLTDEEYKEIKLHAVAGYYILKEISSVHDFAIGARWHHERWDGSGYPDGLKEENIPLIARIIGVADAYDAMTSCRSYRPAMSQEAVRREFEQGSGRQFDPKIAEIMLQMMDEDVNYQMREQDVKDEFSVLVIDDAPTVHLQLRQIIDGDTHYKLQSLMSGDEGIAFLKEESVDLVLLDAEMQGRSGLDVLEWIHANREGLPVIFMTEDKDFSIIQQAEELGVSDYLAKPPSDHMLIASIENVLVGSQLKAS